MRNQSLTANHLNKINDYKICLLKKREKSHVTSKTLQQKYNIIFLISSL